MKAASWDILVRVFTVEPVLKDHPIGHKNVVCQDRWPMVTGSVILKCRSFCRKCVVCQDRWPFMAVVPQDGLHCTMYWHNYACIGSQCSESGLYYMCYLLIWQLTAESKVNRGDQTLLTHSDISVWECAGESRCL